MNAEKVTEIINRIVEENHQRIGYKAARKQYPAAKWQIEKLTSIGIIDFMPKGFGHSDASAVINQAEENGKRQAGGFVNGEGDVTTVAASELYQAINEVEKTVETVSISGAPHQNMAGGVESYQEGSQGHVWYDDNEESWCWCISGVSADGNSYETDDYCGFDTKADALAAIQDYIESYE